MKRFPLISFACVLTAVLALGACSKQGSSAGSSTGSTSSMAASSPASAASQ